MEESQEPIETPQHPPSTPRPVSREASEGAEQTRQNYHNQLQQQQLDLRVTKATKISTGDFMSPYREFHLSPSQQQQPPANQHNQQELLMMTSFLQARAAAAAAAAAAAGATAGTSSNSSTNSSSSSNGGGANAQPMPPPLPPPPHSLAMFPHLLGHPQFPPMPPLPPPPPSRIQQQHAKRQHEENQEDQQQQQAFLEAKRNLLMAQRSQEQFNNYFAQRHLLMPMDDELEGDEAEHQEDIVDCCSEPSPSRTRRQSSGKVSPGDNGSDCGGQQWTFEEQFKQLYELSDDPKRKQFLDDLFAFMQRRGTPVNRIPIMAKQVLDLYELFRLVVTKGGLVEVINKKLWREITKGLNLPSSITSAAFTLRTQYMKYLYPYECDKLKLSSPGELQAAIDGNRREGRRPGYPGFDCPSSAAAAAAAAAALHMGRLPPLLGYHHQGPLLAGLGKPMSECDFPSLPTPPLMMHPPGHHFNHHSLLHHPMHPPPPPPLPLLPPLPPPQPMTPPVAIVNAASKHPDEMATCEQTTTSMKRRHQSQQQQQQQESSNPPNKKLANGTSLGEQQQQQQKQQTSAIEEAENETNNSSNSKASGSRAKQPQHTSNGSPPGFHGLLNNPTAASLSQQQQQQQHLPALPLLPTSFGQSPMTSVRLPPGHLGSGGPGHAPVTVSMELNGLAYHGVLFVQPRLH